MSKMLEIKNLHAGYGGLEVLKGVSIEVKPQEIVALIGPNGAGKSTIIKSIFNIANVTTGEVVFEGKDIRNLRIYELLEIGISYVPQGRIVFGNLTIMENLDIGGNLLNKAEREKRLDYILSKFSVLEERKNDLAFTLSGGERQQLALGRAIMGNPKLLLLDEPSLGLSPKLQKEIFSEIAKLRREGIGILVIEQNAKKAISIADRTYLLEDGKIVLEGGKDILKDKKIQEIYLGGRQYKSLNSDYSNNLYEKI